MAQFQKQQALDQIEIGLTPVLGALFSSLAPESKDFLDVRLYREAISEANISGIPFDRDGKSLL